MEAQLLNVNLDEIEVGETNKMFRDDNDFTPEALQELSESIFKSGVISPILVRPNPIKGKKYQLIAGERRFRASMMVRIADKKRITIPAQIRNLNDEEALEAQVIENLQRENVNPMKEAVAFDWMTMTKKMTTKQISDRIGKSIDYVQERIRLTTLHKDAQELVRTGVLPLKAALKLASIPQQLHQKALSQCITTIEGAKGTTKTFTGLDNLQRWLSWNVFTNLAFADFNTNDPDLVPAAGSCTGCNKRTKNTGGLFDDIEKKDCCFDAVCFRNKQLAQYKQLHEQATLEGKGVKVVFVQRSYNLDNNLKQSISKLGDLVEYNNSLSEITKVQFNKENDDIENLTDLRIGVFVGIDKHYGEDSKKKFAYYAIRKNTSAGRSASSSGSTPADRKKEKDKQDQQRKQNFLEKFFTAEAVIKKHVDKKVSEEFMQQAVRYLLTNEYGDSDAAVFAFKAIGVGWAMEKYDAGKKKKIEVTGQEENIHILLDEYGGPDDEQINDVVSKVKGDKLNALLVYAVFNAANMIDERALLKKMKIDPKAIATKAKTETATWWKLLKSDKINQEIQKVKAGKGSIVQKAKKLAALK